MTSTAARVDETRTARTTLGRLLPRRNPWRHPWFLEGFTWLYLIWSLVPVALAVLFSFNTGRSQSVWQGFSWRWYYQDPVNSVLHNPDLHAAVIQTLRLSVYVTLITVPLGVAFALGINRWRGPVASSFNFVMILSFVIPELIFGVAMFFVFTRLFTTVGLGSLAEVLALVTWIFLVFDRVILVFLAVYPVGLLFLVAAHLANALLDAATDHPLGQPNLAVRLGG